MLQLTHSAIEEDRLKAEKEAMEIYYESLGDKKSKKLDSAVGLDLDATEGSRCEHLLSASAFILFKSRSELRLIAKLSSQPPISKYLEDNASKMDQVETDCDKQSIKRQ